MPSPTGHRLQTGVGTLINPRLMVSLLVIVPVDKIITSMKFQVSRLKLTVYAYVINNSSEYSQLLENVVMMVPPTDSTVHLGYNDGIN